MVPIENNHGYVANIKPSSLSYIIEWKSSQINTSRHFIMLQVS
jgi:hypothetical protein